MYEYVETIHNGAETSTSIDRRCLVFVLEKVVCSKGPERQFCILFLSCLIPSANTTDKAHCYSFKAQKVFAFLS